MMHLVPIHRSFGAFLVLLISAVLLSTWNHGNTTRLAKRQPLTEIPSLLGDHDFSFNVSDPHPSHIINKRARTLTYDQAVCKGRELYYKVILGAFDGTRAPAPEFGPDAIENGWSREQLFRSIPVGLDEAFKALGKDLPNVGERVPTLSETFGVNLVQDKPFVNSAGKKQKAIPMKENQVAHYEVYYVPLWNAMISTDTRSPKYMVQGGSDFTISPEEANKRIPPLNRQSDVMWAVWKAIARFPNDLRYIGRDTITNDDTRGIMNDIFKKGPMGKSVAWPGLTFEIDREEAQALLGTPNGLAIAYILADRAKELGKRSLSVTIFVAEEGVDQGYRMLWDLRPPTYGPPPPAPSLPPIQSFEPLSLTKRSYIQTPSSIASAVRPLQT